MSVRLLCQSRTMDSAMASLTFGDMSAAENETVAGEQFLTCPLRDARYLVLDLSMPRSVGAAALPLT